MKKSKDSNFLGQLEDAMMADELEPREYDPNILIFRRYHPLSSLVDDLGREMGITRTEAMKALKNLLEKLIEWREGYDDRQER